MYNISIHFFYGKYRIYLVKRCGYYYLSCNNRFGDYSNSTTTHCSETIFMQLFLQSIVAYSGAAFNQVNTVIILWAWRTFAQQVTYNGSMNLNLCFLYCTNTKQKFPFFLWTEESHSRKWVPGCCIKDYASFIALIWSEIMLKWAKSLYLGARRKKSLFRVHTVTIHHI